MDKKQKKSKRQIAIEADRRALILFSGGSESTLLVCKALQQEIPFATLTFEYGQTNKEEIIFSNKIVGKLEKRHDVKITRFRMGIRESFSLSRAKLLGKGEAVAGAVNPMYVPSRNLIFASIALGVAESQGFNEVWLGVNFAGRKETSPDSYQEWVLRLNDLAQINTWNPISVKAPLLGLSKEDVLFELRQIDISREEIFSGFEKPIEDEEGA